MRHFDNLPQFYGSKEWEQCKAQVLNERIKADGTIICEHCGKPILKGFNPQANNNKGAMVFHHKIYLNQLNVNDASISINPENIAILHWRCHNEIHGRFYGGKLERKVYLVTGSPCSGKSTWARERLEEGDIVLDIDDIWQMVSGQPRYIKPNQCKPLVFKIRDDIKDLIAKGAGGWRNAFIIESLPNPIERNREAERYKAHNVEIVTMPTSMSECIERLHDNPQGRDLKSYEGYIKEYFDRYKD